MAQHNRFGVRQFVTRFFFLQVLLWVTYNPFGYSVVDWLQAEWTPLSMGSGVILGILWLVLLALVYLGSGWRGLALISTVIGMLLWMARDVGLVRFDNWTANILLAEGALALLLAFGLSWAHIRRRLTGQLSTDDIDDG